MACTVIMAICRYVSYTAAVLRLDVNRKKLNKVRAQTTTVCPPCFGNTNIRPNLIIYFLRVLLANQR